jgi:hypothetical protein
MYRTYPTDGVNMTSGPSYKDCAEGYGAAGATVVLNLYVARGSPGGNWLAARRAAALPAGPAASAVAGIASIAIRNGIIQRSMVSSEFGRPQHAIFARSRGPNRATRVNAGIGLFAMSGFGSLSDIRQGLDARDFWCARCARHAVHRKL